MPQTDDLILHKRSRCDSKRLLGGRDELRSIPTSFNPTAASSPVVEIAARTIPYGDRHGRGCSNSAMSANANTRNSASRPRHNHDPLTSLPNRSDASQRLPRRWRNRPRPARGCAGDLGRSRGSITAIKRIPGNAIGDQILRVVADKLLKFRKMSANKLIPGSEAMT